MNKKEKEKIILINFIRAYKEQINSDIIFNILDRENANKIFPDYSGENPDFIVLINGEYIAIELFNLIGNDLEPMDRNMNENNNIKNVAHLHAFRKEREDYSLFRMEDLAKVASERINDKIQNKLKNYIICPTWFIGYANEPYNCSLLSPYFEDKIEKKVASFIAENIIRNEIITKIWLVEFAKNILLLEIK